MSKFVRAYEVTNLSKVDTTLYNEGDLFITSKSIGILRGGKIESFGNSTPMPEPPDLSTYATREFVRSSLQPFVKGEEVDLMIEGILGTKGYMTRDNVVDLINRAIKDGEILS